MMGWYQNWVRQISPRAPDPVQVKVPVISKRQKIFQEMIKACIVNPPNLQAFQKFLQFLRKVCGS